MNNNGELTLDVRPVGRSGAAAVTVTARLAGEAIAMEELNLAKSKARRDFAKQVADGRPGIDAGAVESALLQEAAKLANKSETVSPPPAEPNTAERLAAMPESVKAEARAMLESPNLLERIGADFAAVGIAGERMLAGTIYLAGVSRLMSKPLALLIQGPSSSGKTHVLRAVATLFPNEAVFKATTLSTLSLYYAQPGTFRHRFVVCGERSRRTDEDQAEVTRALREMISEGRIERLVTVKRQRGPMTAELIQQEGPIAYAETTTLGASDIFTEDLNRMLLLATDETPRQTKAVLRRVAERHEGGLSGDPARVREKHHAMQRMLRAKRVRIPYATALVDRLPATSLEIRRGAGYVLAMVEASALLHQFQRQESSDGEVVATLDDYRLGRALLAHPLGRLLGRQVSHGALRFLGRLIEWFGEQGEYTIPEAKTRETHSVSGVYGWNSDLAGAGLVEVVEHKRGNAPARWRVVKRPEEASDSLSVLPEPDLLENV